MLAGTPLISKSPTFTLATASLNVTAISSSVCTVALAAGTLATLVRDATLGVSLAAIGTFVVALTILGVYLARVRVYDKTEHS